MYVTEQINIQEFKSKLYPARFLKRYNRFFVDAQLQESGEIVTGHCPNTGSMKTCYWDNCTVYLSKNDDPKRKLKYTWELTETAGGYIGVNTALPNLIVKNAVTSGAIPELSGYKVIRPEVKYGKNSRIDLFLDEHPKRKGPCYVEVKNTTLVMGDYNVFPDAVTERGLKHLEEMGELLKDNVRCVMFYLVNRPDGKGFRACEEIDPAYAEGLRQFVQLGGEILAYRTKVSMNSIAIESAVPLL